MQDYATLFSRKHVGLIRNIQESRQRTDEFMARFEPLIVLPTVRLAFAGLNSAQIVYAKRKDQYVALTQARCRYGARPFVA